jgi:hypothetical protein
MKQTNLMRWMEAAEARTVFMLAEEHPARTIVATPNAQPIQMLRARLREQFCLGEASKRLARLYRTAA